MPAGVDRATGPAGRPTSTAGVDRCRSHGSLNPAGVDPRRRPHALPASTAPTVSGGPRSPRGGRRWGGKLTRRTPDADRNPGLIGRPAGLDPRKNVRATFAGVDRAPFPGLPHLLEIRRGAKPGPPEGNELNGGFIRRPIGQTFLV